MVMTGVKSWRGVFTLLLMLLLTRLSDGQCDFSALDGMEYFVEYSANGDAVIQEYNDATDEITITNGSNVETMKCVMEAGSIGLFDMYIFNQTVNGALMYYCVEQLVDRGMYIILRKVSSATPVDSDSCEALLDAAPMAKSILFKYPLSELPAGSCGLTQGDYHGIYGNTQPRSCAEDVYSAISIEQQSVITSTCSADTPTHETPHQATFSCLIRISESILKTGIFTIASAEIGGRIDVYCLSTSEVNGQLVLSVYPRVGPLSCSSATPQFNLTLELDQCDLGVCQNGATCTQLSNGYTCVCTPGYTGKDCSVDINECGSTPCFNGLCIDRVNGYECDCTDSGYTGGLCEIEINECVPKPCVNGATCNNQIGYFTCDCVPGYMGLTCSEEVDECESQPCQSGGSCIDGLALYECDCRPGYTGANCQTNIDECQSAPCENGGTCVDLENAYTCQCRPGYAGANCDSDLDECDSDPCQNGGTCTNQVNQYTCDCPEGILGINCEINIDDCEDVDCGEGDCEDGVNDYTCRCHPGRTGELCDMVAPDFLDNDIIPMAIGTAGCLAAIMMLTFVCMARKKKEKKEAQDATFHHY